MIANMLEGMEHEEAARLAGLSRSAAYEWHNRYEEDGIEGLRDRPRPGRQPRVDAVTSARFKERIVAGAELQRDGVVAFRAVDAQRILKEEFEIDCSLPGRAWPRSPFRGTPCPPVLGQYRHLSRDAL
jgi:transposase